MRGLDRPRELGHQGRGHVPAADQTELGHAHVGDIGQRGHLGKQFVGPDHGADVVKVEAPGGDETRDYGPPFVDGRSTYYLDLSRNKRGMVLDLSTREGQEIVRRLVQQSDVLVENFRTGTMERWGLSYEQLRDINPRLVFATISGFGRSGPYAPVAGYDGALQAFGGFMSINGEEGGEPLKAEVAIADLTTGLFAAQAILLALVNRHVTGQGQLVEVSLLDSMFADMEAVFTYEGTGHVQALIVGREITGCQAFAPGRGR